MKYCNGGGGGNFVNSFLRSDINEWLTGMWDGWRNKNQDNHNNILLCGIQHTANNNITINTFILGDPIDKPRDADKKDDDSGNWGKIGLKMFVNGFTVAPFFKGPPNDHYYVLSRYYAGDFKRVSSALNWIYKK